MLKECGDRAWRLYGGGAESTLQRTGWADGAKGIKVREVALLGIISHAKIEMHGD